MAVAMIQVMRRLLVVVDRSLGPSEGLDGANSELGVKAARGLPRASGASLRACCVVSADSDIGRLMVVRLGSAC